MKKSISLVLCLAMLVSVFSCIGVTASAVSAQDLFTVKSSGFKDDKVTYTVYLNAGVNLSGAIIYAKFDSSVLAIDKANSGAYMTTDSYGDERQNIDGMYEADFMAGYNDQFSIAHAYGQDADYKAGSSDKAYMQFTFKAIDENRPATTVKFYCYEFNSASNPDNNIPNGSSALVYSLKETTLGVTTLSAISSVKGGVQISWKKTTGADGYYIYKKVNGSYSQIDTVDGGSVTSYIDTGVKNNTSYTYTVRAFNEAGRNSGYDKAGLTATYIVAPSGITAKVGVNSVTVTWSKVSGANGYRLYRRVVNKDGTTGDWVYFSKTTSLSTTDSTSTLKSGYKYEYAVRSYSSDSSSSLYNSTTINYLGTPQVTVKSAYSGVSITWNKVNGASSYRIYRKVSGTSNWVAITTVSSSTTSYTDTAAPNNSKIYYTVKALNGSVAGAYEGVYVNYIKAPKATLSNARTGVQVSWNKISGATKYYVYRKTSSSGSWTRIATVTGTSYTDKSAKNNKTYYYTVRSANSSRTSSYYSTGWIIKFLSAPKLSSVSSSKSGITFTWSKVTGASGYIVYRKTGSGSYQQIAKVSGNSTVKYLDKTAKKGTTYTYTVRAYYSSYKSSYNTGLTIKDKY